MIRIFLADDHPLVRQGLRRAIEAQPDMSVVGEASDGWQVLQAENRDAWDVLVLDLSLPRISGMEVLRRLRIELPNLPILVLSMYSEEQYASRLLAEGAAGYLSKDQDPAEVLAAIRTVAAGRTSFSSEVLSQLRRGQPERPHERLSAREFQVFMQLIAGRSVSDIASELNVSGSTVSNHVMKIREKLGARTVGEIIRYAHQVGLLGPS
jgi:DNA-binding NarL/FixJ family response regulator